MAAVDLDSRVEDLRPSREVSGLDPDTAAALEVGRRRANQAFTQLGKARRALAEVTDGYRSSGHVRVDHPDDADAARELILQVLEQRGPVHVVLLHENNPTSRAAAEGSRSSAQEQEEGQEPR